MSIDTLTHQARGQAEELLTTMGNLLCELEHAGEITLYMIEMKDQISNIAIGLCNEVHGLTDYAEVEAARELLRKDRDTDSD